MGEKIRDIRPINLIGNELMVELNEGYTKNQGRVIHIQNKKFRYLLTEGDFYKVASDIMRAAVELRYIKTHLPNPSDGMVAKEEREPSAVCEFTFLETLKEEEVEYRILEVRNHLLTVLIKPDCYKGFKKLAKRWGLKRLEHPFGKRHGYKFLYQMQEFAIYEKDGWYYEIFCQLPCKSLTPKMWMPLDKCVQQALWATKQEKDGYLYVAEEEMWIYRMTRSMFTSMTFTEKDKAFLESYKQVLTSDTLKEKLNLIVFGFANRLVELASQGNYDAILTEYYSYKDY